MDVESPPSLLSEAMRVLLEEEALAVRAVSWLPSNLFVCLFTEAWNRKYTKLIEGLVQGWPFLHLPLNIFTKQLHQEWDNVTSVLNGIDLQLNQDAQNRKSRLRVLNCLSKKPSCTWYGLGEYEGASVKRPAAEARSKKHSVPALQVLLDVTDNAESYGFFSYIFHWVNKREDIHLCCKKLHFSDTDIQKHVLSKVDPDCIEEMEIQVTWPMPPGFTSVVGKMTSLQKLFVSFIRPSRKEPEDMQVRWQEVFSLLASQLHKLHSLKQLYVTSAVTLKCQLGQTLRCLVSPLETLSISNYTSLEPDFFNEAQCLNVTHLKELCLRDTRVPPDVGCLQQLLKRCAPSLQYLDLSLCGIRDYQLDDILPALSHCSQLRMLNLHGNSLSLGLVQQLLRHTACLPRMSLEVLPAPRESYSFWENFESKQFECIYYDLIQLLRELGNPGFIIFTTSTICSYCGVVTLVKGQPTLRLPNYCPHEIIDVCPEDF